MKINYLDLFSGIGGFSEGIRQSGIEFAWHGFSEIDKFAIKVYKNHFPEAVELGSVTSIDGRKLPKLNLVTFGFPCQDLSIAGKRRGLDGKRSGLFFEAIRIIDENKPDYFIFENVKGLLSSNDGKDFEIVLRTIADIGYDGQWQLLNTSWFLPQNRERIYFVGHPRKGSRPEIFPIGEGIGRIDEGAGKTPNVRCLTGGGAFRRTPQHNDTIANAIDANYGKGDNRFSNKSGRTRIFTDIVPTLKSETKKGDTEPLIKESQSIRSLTPTECERLQGFPDGWTRYGCDGKEISDSQRYKMLGNAVSVPVVKAVINRLKKWL